MKPIVRAAGLLLTLSLLPAAVPAEAAERPNIVFVMADDLGYGELGCYGQEQIRTPHLDRMAAEGMRFTQVYSGSTVCAPTRSSLMTGRHTGHTRVRGNKRVPLKPGDVTVAEVLHEAGYATSCIGKWGIGEPGTTGVPNKQGFDHFFGFLNQRHAHRHYPEFLWRNDEKVEYPENRGDGRGTYAHDAMTKEAFRFIRRQQDGPFFLYLAYTIPHAEILVPEDSLQEYHGRFPEEPFGGGHYAAQPQPNAALAGMITRMDHDMGRLFALLKELSLDENTVVFFTSDNGPVSVGGRDAAFFDANGPLRGRKRDLYDGGIRVPMLVRWPGRIPAGVVSDAIWAHWDALPTFADLAGVDPPENIDGVSVVPTLLGETQPELDERFLYWEFHRRGFHQAVRQGRWKAIRHGLGEPLELYDLSVAVSESENVAADHPGVVQRIEEYLQTARTESPYWPVGESR